MTHHSEHSAEAAIDALVAEITSARAELLASVAGLKAQLTPGALGRRGLAAASGVFTDEFGGVKPKPVAIAAGTLASVIGLKFLTRRHH